MSTPKITIKIDRIVTDRPGLERAELTAALHREVHGLMAERGSGALGPGRSLESASGRVARPNAAGIAGATIKVLGS